VALLELAQAAVTRRADRPPQAGERSAAVGGGSAVIGAGSDRSGGFVGEQDFLCWIGADAVLLLGGCLGARVGVFDPDGDGVGRGLDAPAAAEQLDQRETESTIDAGVGWGAA
jgi:hypothetical protein